MKFKVFETQTIDKGINSESGKPFISKDNKYIIHNCYIKYDSDSKLSSYKKYEIISMDWWKGRLYVTLSIQNDKINQTITCTPCKAINSLMLFMYLKFDITKLMAWIGGILSMILTVKEIFN